MNPLEWIFAFIAGVLALNVLFGLIVLAFYRIFE